MSEEVERLKSENQSLKRQATTEAVIERNAKIQDLEQRNQELRVKLTEVRKKLVDVEAHREDIQRTLDRTRVKLFNLEPESTAALGSEALDQEAMGLPSTNPAQSEPNKISETTDRPPCPNCGKTTTVHDDGRRKKKDGSLSQRWRCKPCHKSWSVAIQ